MDSVNLLISSPFLSKIAFTCVHGKSLHSCPPFCEPMDRSPPGSSVHGDSPGENTAEGCHSLLRGNLPNQGSNLCLLCLLHWQAYCLPLAPPGKSDLTSPLPQILPGVLLMSSCLKSKQLWTACCFLSFLAASRTGHCWQQVLSPVLLLEHTLVIGLRLRTNLCQMNERISSSKWKKSNHYFQYKHGMFGKHVRKYPNTHLVFCCPVITARGKIQSLDIVSKIDTCSKFSSV